MQCLGTSVSVVEGLGWHPKESGEGRVLIPQPTMCSGDISRLVANETAVTRSLCPQCILLSDLCNFSSREPVKLLSH